MESKCNPKIGAFFTGCFNNKSPGVIPAAPKKPQQGAARNMPPKQQKAPPGIGWNNVHCAPHGKPHAKEASKITRIGWQNIPAPPPKPMPPARMSPSREEQCLRNARAAIQKAAPKPVPPPHRISVAARNEQKYKGIISRTDRLRRGGGRQLY